MEQVCADKTNISVDLICGLPCVATLEWEHMIQFVIACIKPNHISIYDLQLEYDAIFGNWYLSSSKQNDNILPPSNKIYYNLPTMQESIQMCFFECS